MATAPEQDYIESTKEGAMFPNTLRREILLLIAVKAALLLALYFLFFSPAHRPTLTPDRLSAHLLGRS